MVTLGRNRGFLTVILCAGCDRYSLLCQACRERASGTQGISPSEHTAREEIAQFSLKNTIKITRFAAEVSETEIKFLDTTEYKGDRFKTELVLDVYTH